MIERFLTGWMALRGASNDKAIVEDEALQARR
jgi:hypothetical protein